MFIHGKSIATSGRIVTIPTSRSSMSRDVNIGNSERKKKTKKLKKKGLKKKKAPKKANNATITTTANGKSKK